MIDIALHIAYLLTKHECVIIPGFGAFVVSKNRNNNGGNFYLMPSYYSIGFNSEIIHNDGLLINSIMQVESVSYEAGSERIDQYVKDIQGRLAAKHIVRIAWVGELFHSEEKNILFTPFLQLSCHAIHFGLNRFSMPLLSELEDQRNSVAIDNNHRSESKDFDYIRISKNKLRKGITTVAAIFALALISTPLNQNLRSDSQRAGMLSIPVSQPVQQVSLTPSTESIDLSTADKEVESTENIISEQHQKNSRSYYIVIASLPTLDSANAMLKNIQQDYFPDAKIISSGDKNRIYVKEYQNKQEAEDFLKQFRAEYPKYTKAWLLSQRSNR